MQLQDTKLQWNRAFTGHPDVFYREKGTQGLNRFFFLILFSGRNKLDPHRVSHKTKLQSQPKAPVREDHHTKRPRRSRPAPSAPRFHSLLKQSPGLALRSPDSQSHQIKQTVERSAHCSHSVYLRMMSCWIRTNTSKQENRVIRLQAALRIDRIRYSLLKVLREKRKGHLAK